MKKLCQILGVLTLVASCAPTQKVVDYGCPNVQIPRATAYAMQKAGYSEEVRLELIGYEGYCLKANTVDRRYAVIRPLFKIIRLSEGYDTRIDFSYYTETIKGPPEFLGRRRYFASVDIPRDVYEKEFAGRQIKVRLPGEDYADFAILLGMENSATERDYNQKMFDVEYRYLSADEKQAYSQPVTPRVIEVEKAPDVQYMQLKPLPVKRPAQPQNDCGCKL